MPSARGRVSAGLSRALSKATVGLKLAEALRCERSAIICVWRDIRRGDWEIFNVENTSRFHAATVRPLMASRMAQVIRLDNQAVEAAAKAAPERLKAMQQLEELIQNERDGGAGEWRSLSQRWAPDPFALLPAFSRAAQSYASAKADVRSLEAAIALRNYRIDKKRLATDFEELVPEYLPRAPRDPFTGGELRFRREGGYVTVYSVGPNRRDDGGQLESGPDDRMAPDIGVRIAE